MKQMEIKKTVEEMFRELSSLLSLYEETKGFQTGSYLPGEQPYCYRLWCELRREAGMFLKFERGSLRIFSYPEVNVS